MKLCFGTLLTRGSIAAALALMGAMLPHVAHAGLIAYEPFNYAAGSNLDAKTGGTGWTSSWGPKLVPVGPAIPVAGAVIQAGSLAAPVGLPTLGGHVRMSAENGAFEMARSFPNVPGTAGTNTWYSFLGQRIGSNAGGTNWPNNPYPRGANMGLFDKDVVAQGGTNYERVGVGNSTTVNGVDAAHYDEWSLIPQGSGTLREGPASHSPKWSELAWAVLRIEHVGDATVADNMWLWLNPDPLGGEPLTANAAVTILNGDTNSRDISNVDYIRPFLGAAQNVGNAATSRPAAVMLIDEIRLGTGWDDMRATPEPATGVLVALAGIALTARRKRR